MPWGEATQLPFSRIAIVSRVPSESGVYAIWDGDSWVFVGDSWNLRARLLELAAVLGEVEHLTIAYEVCPDERRSDRKVALTSELIGQRGELSPPPVNAPGLLFSLPVDR
jgi:hypothetical protein